MRLSFISTLALLLPLRGSAEQVGGASSRSSLDTPSLFAVREKYKNPSSPASTVFAIPRGGARAVAPAKAPAKVTSIVGGGLNLPSDIFSKEKRGWTISLVINLAYIFFFIRKNYFDSSYPVSCDVSEAGFCVTRLAECANDGDLMNSHTWAFLADLYYTYRGLTIPSDRTKLAQYGLVFTIFGHGLLHLYLGAWGKCGIGPIPGGDQLFLVAAAVFSFAVLQVGAQFETFDRLKKLVLSAAGGWLTLQLAGPNGENGVSSIFMITHILGSVSSVFFPGTNIKNMEELGNSFVPPCLISLIELLYCCGGDGGASLFNKLGGHVWYDVFLHRSVLVAINNGAEKE